MKKFILSKDSKTYKFLKFCGALGYGNETTFCEVVSDLLKMLVIVVISTAAALLILSPVIYTIIWFIKGQQVPFAQEMINVLIAEVLIGIGVSCVFGLLKWLDRQTNLKYQLIEDGFIPVKKKKKKKQIKLNQDGMFYKFLTLFDSIDDTSLGSIITRFCFTVIVCIFGMAATICILFPFGDLIAWLAAWYVTGIRPAVGPCVIVIFYAIPTIWFLLTKVYGKITKQMQRSNFWVVLFQTIKNKTCVQISVE